MLHTDILVLTLHIVFLRNANIIAPTTTMYRRRYTAQHAILAKNEKFTLAEVVSFVDRNRLLFLRVERDREINNFRVIKPLKSRSLDFRRTCPFDLTTSKYVRLQSGLRDFTHHCFRLDYFFIWDCAYFLSTFHLCVVRQRLGVIRMRVYSQVSLL